MSKKLIYFGFLILIFNFSFLIFNLRSASAQTMSNQDYIIRMQGFNTVSGVTEGKDYSLRSTVGGLSPLVSEGVNYKVKTGFENLASTFPFSISLSTNLVDFGILSPTNPVIRAVDLGINSEAAYGYSVIVFENEPSASEVNKTFIPDTGCDNGRCDTQNASEWTNALTYGFGYRCDNITRLPSPANPLAKQSEADRDGEANGGQAGAGCNSSFTIPNSYKRFPNIAGNDDPASIMAGIGANNRETRISYKVNISVSQAQGTYSNTVTYIAVPNF